MRLASFICFIIFFLIWNKAISQVPTPLHFKSITINNGLSQGFISSIIQDKQGLMWFATSDGLNKYDGYNFTVYHHDADDPYSLGSDDLTYVFEDSKQRLWIATRNNGLDYFDRASNKFYHIRRTDDQSIISNNVTIINEDKEGALWITTESGIDRMEILPSNSSNGNKDFLATHTLRFTHIKADKNVIEKTFNNIIKGSIFTDSKGYHFFVTNNHLYELKFTDYNKYSFRRLATLPVRDSNFVTGILEDVRAKNLITNGEQIILFQKYDFLHPRTLYEYEKFRPGHVWLIDKDRRIWANEGAGLKCINLSNNEQHYYIPADSLQDDALRTTTCMYSDRQGVLWIGTGGYGILKYDPEFERFHRILPGTRQYQISEVRPGEIMTNNFQTIILKRGQPPQYPSNAFLQSLQQKFLNHNILRFAKDTDGNIWIPDGRDLYQYNLHKKESKVYHLSSPKEKGRVYPIYADKDNHLWFNLKQQLVRFIPPESFYSVSYPFKTTELEDDFLQTIYEEGNILWLGTTKGLFRFNKLKGKIESNYFFHAQNKHSLSNNFILSLCNDIKQPERYLWIGTKGGGLNRLDKTTGKFLRYNTKHGLANNVVYGILPGDDGNLWLSTNRGLSAFHPETEVFRNYDEEDGLQSNEFNRYSYCKTSEGLLIFGGMNGINYFDPRELKPLEPPPVVFTEFRLFNKKVNVREADGPLSLDINYASEIRLRYHQNVITFQFAGMDYRRQGNIHYRYKMEGFDKEWIYGGTMHEATYTNLAPGQYTFSVQGSFDNVVWGKNEKSIRLIILTPWYRTWWFSLLLITSIALLLYGLYRFRRYQLKRIEKLRDRIARDLHDEVGSSISTISIYSKIMQEQWNGQNFDNRPLIDKITVFSREIMESMNDIVWNINTRNDSFDRIFSKMREYAFQLLEPNGYEVYFDLDDSLNTAVLSMERRREFYLIYKEALNNIVKYALGNNVWITLKIKQNNIVLVVKDNGKGFNATVQTSGNGLHNMKQRAEFLKGNLTVQSELGKGTEVSLVFSMM